MEYEVITIELIHHPKFTSEANGFGVNVKINDKDVEFLELTEDQMLHIGAILLNATRKFINNADKTKEIVTSKS